MATNETIQERIAKDKEVVLDALNKSSGIVASACKAAGISRFTFYKWLKEDSDFAEKASKQSSEREIIAMQIERKAEDCYKAEYARRHLGECYEGRISGVTQRGLFIELENGVEGFVPASSLTPSGTMLTEGIRLSDPVSGKNWSLGDTMMITIVRADVNLGKIDFEVAPANAK